MFGTRLGYLVMVTFPSAFRQAATYLPLLIAFQLNSISVDVYSIVKLDIKGTELVRT